MSRLRLVAAVLALLVAVACVAAAVTADRHHTAEPVRVAAPS